MNELGNFQFSVNYKPGIQNNKSGSLSRLPKSSQDLEEYSQICSVEEVRAIFDGSLNQTNGEETWIPLINNITVKEEGEDNQLLYDATDKTIALTTQDLVKAQKEESWIKRLFEITKRHQCSNAFKDTEKLEIDENYFLYKKIIGDRKQLILLKKLRPLVYVELHFKV